jgi:hypothetical protein
VRPSLREVISVGVHLSGLRSLLWHGLARQSRFSWWGCGGLVGRPRVRDVGDRLLVLVAD